LNLEQLKDLFLYLIIGNSCPIQAQKMSAHHKRQLKLKEVLTEMNRILLFVQKV